MCVCVYIHVRRMCVVHSQQVLTHTHTHTHTHTVTSVQPLSYNLVSLAVMMCLFGVGNGAVDIGKSLRKVGMGRRGLPLPAVWQCVVQFRRRWLGEVMSPTPPPR